MPEVTARLVNGTVAAGRRVVAVGTTVVRALESAAPAGQVVPTSGWTSLVLGPDRPARVVTGLLTGLHEPEASHLDLLEAVAGRSWSTAATRCDRPGVAGLPVARVRRHDAAAPLTGRVDEMTTPQPKGRLGCGAVASPARATARQDGHP